MPHEIKNFFQKIQQSKSIAILGHITPDADAFGSAMALREIIRKYYQSPLDGKKQRKKIDIFLDCDKFPESFKMFLPNDLQKLRFINPENPKPKYDLAIAVDCLNADRLGKYKSVFENAKTKANIDHHASNTRFADFNFIAKTSSTCEAIYYLFIANKSLETSKYLLSLLYSGIITDTYNLKDNADGISTEKALSYIKQKVGIPLLTKIRENFFANNSPAKDELNALAYNKKNRRYFADGKVCLIMLDKKSFKKAGATLEDAEGIVDDALYRKGVLISGIILEKDKNSVCVKLRGKQGIDVSKIATIFGGGGHPNKAAFQTTANPKTILYKLAQECGDYVKNQSEFTEENFSELFQ